MANEQIMQEAIEQREAQITDLQGQVVELRKALNGAMTPSEVLARPHDYEKWYNGMRAEALGNG